MESTPESQPKPELLKERPTEFNRVTVGELVRRTGDELLECKNFGVTSLNEVREKLTQYGIKLRGD